MLSILVLENLNGWEILQKRCKLVSSLCENFASICLISSYLEMGAQKQSTRTEKEKEKEREGRRKGQRWGPGPRVANLEQVQQLTQILVASERH